MPVGLRDSHTGYKKVDYAVLVAPVIEAFKELNQRVQDLFTTSESHSVEIAALRAENERLQAADASKVKQLAELKTRMDLLEARLAKQLNRTPASK